jgi:hypothetical protein
MTNVFLTYNNTAHTDGAGAQLYRIYGIYALTRMLGLRYLHSPLFKIDHQGLAILQSQHPDETLVTRFNQSFSIQSDGILPDDAIVRLIADPVPGFETSLLAESTELNRPILAKITYPHRIIDCFPDAMLACQFESPFRIVPNWNGTRPLRVAVHVRRGDVRLLEPDRLLPNAYYIEVIRNIRRCFEGAGLAHSIEIHSETSNAEFVVSSNGFGVYNLTGNSVYRPDDDAFDEFKEVEPVLYRFNEETLDSFKNIASADIIVTSKSCFSYLAAILNPKAAVIYHPFFHSPLSTWLVSQIDGAFDHEKLLAHFRSGTVNSAV